MSIDEIKKLLKAEFESIEFIDKSNDYDFEMIKSINNCRVFDDLNIFVKLHRKSHG